MSKVKKSRTKISDVANHLGVHKTTVSRALNNSSGISKSLALKIKKAARELNYIPNRAAQSLCADTIEPLHYYSHPSETMCLTM